MVFKKIRDWLFGSPDSEPRDREGIYLYVKCSKCGAPVQIRVDKRHDLVRDFEQGGYILNKEIMDGTCFQLMYATVRFNPAYRIVEQEVKGGEFISWEEYRALARPSE